MSFWPVRQRIAELERCRVDEEPYRHHRRGSAATITRIRKRSTRVAVRGGRPHSAGPVRSPSRSWSRSPKGSRIRTDSCGCRRSGARTSGLVDAVGRADRHATRHGHGGFRRRRERRRQLPRSVVRPVVLVLTPHPSYTLTRHAGLAQLVEYLTCNRVGPRRRSQRKVRMTLIECVGVDEANLELRVETVV